MFPSLFWKNVWPRQLGSDQMRRIPSINIAIFSRVGGPEMKILEVAYFIIRTWNNSKIWARNIDVSPCSPCFFDSWPVCRNCAGRVIDLVINWSNVLHEVRFVCEDNRVSVSPYRKRKVDWTPSHEPFKRRYGLFIRFARFSCKWVM